MTFPPNRKSIQQLYPTYFRDTFGKIRLKMMQRKCICMIGCKLTSCGCLKDVNLRTFSWRFEDVHRTFLQNCKAWFPPRWWVPSLNFVAGDKFFIQSSSPEVGRAMNIKISKSFHIHNQSSLPSHMSSCRKRRKDK